ncbi:MAG: rubrerythrin family protein [Haloarculaceae archaeon]
MDIEDFTDDVREDANTELSRLGSSKSLYADTGGEMDEAHVRAALANWFAGAADVFETWVDDSAAAQRDLFESVAELSAEQAAAIADDADYEDADHPAIVTALQHLETPEERVGGFLGWSLVTAAKTSQAVGFFVGQADPQAADELRTVDDDVDANVSRAREVLARVVEPEAGEDPDDALARAHEAAVDVIEAAYDEYVEELEAQGVNPKPVC